LARNHPGGPVNDGSFRRAIGADKTVAATPATFFCALRANQKPKENIRPQAVVTYSICCGFSRPIRSSPKFAKANSIVWMIPNEWPRPQAASGLAGSQAG